LNIHWARGENIKIQECHANCLYTQSSQIRLIHASGHLGLHEFHNLLSAENTPVRIS
jgi:hypothetical protein